MYLAFYETTQCYIHVHICAPLISNMQSLLQVSPEFLLLGLIHTEEPISKEGPGFYGSGITLDRARTAMEALHGRMRQENSRKLSSHPHMPFSRDAQRVFESAAEVPYILITSTEHEA